VSLSLHVPLICNNLKFSFSVLGREKKSIFPSVDADAKIKPDKDKIEKAEKDLKESSEDEKESEDEEGEEGEKKKKPKEKIGFRDRKVK
jgi:hypothetical protein